MKKKLILTIVLLFVGVFSFSVSAASSRFAFNGTDYSVVVDVDYIETLSNGVVYDVSVSVQNLQPEKWVTSSQFLPLIFSGNGTNYQVYDSYDCAPYVSSYGNLSLYPEGNIVLAPGEMKQYHFKLLVVGTSSTAVSVSAGSFPASSAYSFDDLILLPADELAYLSQLDSRLSDLIAAVSYSGSYFDFIPSNSVNYTGTSFLVSNGVTVNVIRRVGRPYLISSNVSYDPVNDVSHIDYSYVTPVSIYLSFINSNSYSARASSRSFNISSLFPSNAINNVRLDYFYSDLFDNVYFSNTVEFRYRNRDNSYGYVPSGYNYSVISVSIVCDDVTALSWPDPSTSSSFFSSSNDYYAARDSFNVLKDIYNAFANSDRSDQDQLSSDITSTSNSIHSQEEQYFSSNAQAIQATGLSNYRFDQNQTGGISAVSNDFTAVFNALGGFNSVFIFSLTLSLALQIFRHHPIVFRAKQVNTTPKVGKGDP